MSAARSDSSGRVWLRCLLGLVIVALLVGGTLAYQLFLFLRMPGDYPPREVEVTVTPGMSFSALARELAAEGVITSEKKFVFYARYKKMTNIKSGRFRVNTGWSPAKVLDQLVNGLPYLERVTIPEGLAWWETGRRLEQAGLVRFEDFEKVIHDPAFLRHWGIPFPSAEGFLFPDTYLIGRPLELNEASARSVAGRMVDTFWRRTAGLWPEGKRPGPGKAGLVRDRVRLASIVEKETAVPNERARVAGVYANRLQAGMRLQADPTVIYGLGPSFSGPIRRSQLNDAGNPYNTYQKNGLPPGPICSPGLASLAAAFAPEQHKFLYFVAVGDGSHTFSTNLRDHNSAVDLYRQNVRRGQNPPAAPRGQGS